MGTVNELMIINIKKMSTIYILNHIYSVLIYELLISAFRHNTTKKHVMKTWFHWYISFQYMMEKGRDSSIFQLQIKASVRERPLQATWATTAAPTLSAEAVPEPTLLF